MALATSGTMSIGGSTATRSINLELGRGATATSSLGEADFRGLAGVASGAISMSDFYGASSSVGGEFIEVAGNVRGSVICTAGWGFNDCRYCGLYLSGLSTQRLYDPFKSAVTELVSCLLLLL